MESAGAGWMDLTGVTKVQSDAELADSARRVLTEALEDDDVKVKLQAAKETLSFVDNSIASGPFAHLTDAELAKKAAQLAKEAKELVHG